MHLSAPLYRLKRRAKQMSRETNAPLHQCLNRVALTEGFQSWDHLSDTHKSTSGAILAKLPKGALTLLAARPGQGKTLMALELSLAAARTGPATFYTLDYSQSQVSERLMALSPSGVPKAFKADYSDQICADYIIGRQRPGFIAIDYLQLLDQRRDLPPLQAQCAALRDYATSTGSRVVLISQVHRDFDASDAKLPGPEHIRLPNPVDLSQFTRRIFLHEGRVEIQGA